MLNPTIGSVKRQQFVSNLPHSVSPPIVCLSQGFLCALHIESAKLGPVAGCVCTHSHAHMHAHMPTHTHCWLQSVSDNILN